MKSSLIVALLGAFVKSDRLDCDRSGNCKVKEIDCPDGFICSSDLRCDVSKAVGQCDQDLFGQLSYCCPPFETETEPTKKFEDNWKCNNC